MRRQIYSVAFPRFYPTKKHRETINRPARKSNTDSKIVQKYRDAANRSRFEVVSRTRSFSIYPSGKSRVNPTRNRTNSRVKAPVRRELVVLFRSNCSVGPVSLVRRAENPLGVRERADGRAGASFLNGVMNISTVTHRAVINSVDGISPGRPRPFNFINRSSEAVLSTPSRFHLNRNLGRARPALINLPPTNLPLTRRQSVVSTRASGFVRSTSLIRDRSIRAVTSESKHPCFGIFLFFFFFFLGKWGGTVQRITFKPCAFVRYEATGILSSNRFAPSLEKFSPTLESNRNFHPVRSSRRSLPFENYYRRQYPTYRSGTLPVRLPTFHRVVGFFSRTIDRNEATNKLLNYPATRVRKHPALFDLGNSRPGVSLNGNKNDFPSV